MALWWVPDVLGLIELETGGGTLFFRGILCCYQRLVCGYSLYRAQPPVFAKDEKQHGGRGADARLSC